MVAGFAQSSPNPRLVEFADAKQRQSGAGRVLDIGCGAARNAVPLAARGWHVVGTDLSTPMLLAAAKRAADEGVADRVRLIDARMDALPVRGGSFDLIVAHGIWNLARAGDEFRAGVNEAARAATPGACSSSSRSRGRRFRRRPRRFPARRLSLPSSPGSRSASSRTINWWRSSAARGSRPCRTGRCGSSISAVRAR